MTAAKKEFISLPLTKIGEEKERDGKIERSCLKKRYKTHDSAREPSERTSNEKRKRCVFVCFIGATTLQCNRIDTFLSITLNAQHPK